jgi:hypothetical protein
MTAKLLDERLFFTLISNQLKPKGELKRQGRLLNSIQGLGKETSRMTNAFHENLQEIDDEKLDDFTYEHENTPSVSDDNGLNIDISRHIEHMLDSITRIGGEVCKLRAEVDGLLEQNGSLTDTFRKLRDVIDEKGMLDVDDFQLALDVFDESNNKVTSNHFFKKMSH